jgi:hypothetical protein
MHEPITLCSPSWYTEEILFLLKSVSVHVSHPKRRVFTGIDWKTSFFTHVLARDLKKLFRFAICALACLTLFAISVSSSR